MAQPRFFQCTVSILMALTACGPSVGEADEDEEVRTFERRRPGCELFCGLLQDPECGSEVEIYESEGECVDFCMSEDSTQWRLQDDDSDACADEFVGLYECASTSCETQWVITNVPSRVSETPCESGLAEFFECQAQYPEVDE